MIFKKARQNRIFQDIVDQIQQAVVAGELNPGEKLPPEREMCTVFHTSRGTLREALRILEQKRLISIKLGSGGGAVVREPNGELIAENLSLLVRAKQGSESHLADLTAKIFGLLATAAATKAEARDVGPLKQLVANVSAEMEGQRTGENILLRMDQLLINEMGRISDNPLYVFFMQAALEAIQNFQPQQQQLFDDAQLKQHYQEIRLIVYAIAKNEHMQAGQLAEKHIRRLIQPAAA